MKRAFASVLLLLLSIILIVVPNVPPARAATMIRILGDGTIYPSSAPITRVGSIYYFTDNISDSWISVEKNSIVVDGRGHTLDGIELVDVGFTLGGVSNVTIRNTTITGFTSYGICLNTTHHSLVDANSLAINTCGIMIDASHDIVVAGNRIDSNEYGITLRNSYHSMISQNRMGFNYFHCVGLENSEQNSIHNNILENSEYYGIELRQSWNNSVYENTIRANLMSGIILFDPESIFNEFHGNLIEQNFYGVSLIGEGFAAPSNNAVYHNSFMNNSIQARGLDLAVNFWDDGYPSGGNYWDDYNGTDANQDGIGDTSYVIDTNNQDNYPLVVPFGPLTPPGMNITVFPADAVCMIFEMVLEEGFTTVEEPQSGPAPPSGLSIVGYYIIETTADCTGSIRLRIIYGELMPISTGTTQEESLQLLQCIMLAGDVDEDFNVDIFDMVRMAGVYRVEKPDIRYNPKCDLDHDGDIDIFDIVRAAGNYGKTWDPSTGWNDITTRVDEENNSIFGVTNRLSIFGVTRSS